MNNDDTTSDPQKQHRRKRLLMPTMAGLIVILLMSTAFFAWQYFTGGKHKEYPIPAYRQTETQVSLGSLTFRQEGDRLIRRSDESVKQIQAFLKAQPSGCQDNDGVYQVIAHNSDETQLLLGYGCGNSNSRMFAIKKNGNWRTVSPTNQFNQFGVPSCNMVESNTIATEIAPVCQNESRTAENAPLTYSYKVR